MAKWDHDDLRIKYPHPDDFGYTDPRNAVVVTNTPRAGESPEQTAARTAPRRKGDFETEVEYLKSKRALDTQVGGDHYTNKGIQPFEYSMRNKLDPMQHTIIKYVTRFREKGGKLDLEKARHTIDLLIEYEYGNERLSD